ncbi:ABC transporter ATP-binding protein [Acidipropionibacterium jensenii]|uniref:ABC transporter ATP-binding protein n=1 Tax=Acidipropionibacterium jensenii TaxID=1749 RepID=UPI0034538711
MSTPPRRSSAPDPSVGSAETPDAEAPIGTPRRGAARPQGSPYLQNPAQPYPGAQPWQSGAPAAGPRPEDLAQDAAAALGVTKVYGSGPTQVVALNGVDVQFRRGSFTAIMGPSGSGKSTLMHCLAGLDRITSGRVLLAGKELSTLPDKALTRVRRDEVGFIFQSFNLLPTLTARQNILLPLDLAGASPDPALFDQLTQGLGIADRLNHRPSELSGGQQQRVACARAMIAKPSVVFADEPTGALDFKSGTALLEYLRHCATDLHQTIIMVTHDARAASYSDRALMLLDGRIVDDIDSPTAETVGTAMANLEA